MTQKNFTRADVELLEQRTLWQGYYRMVLYRLRHRLHGGGWSGEIAREVFERGHAAAVVPYDPLRDEVVLIRQFRPGAYAARMGPWLWEIIAGILEKDETPEALILREAREEAGLTLSDPIRIGKYLVSPGGTSESCTIFCARVDAATASGIHGLKSENEDIAVHALPYARVMAMLAGEQICNAKTIIGLQWLALNRDSLCRQWQ